MSNSLQILCIKDTEGFWTVNERYPARQFCRALAHLMKMHENHYKKRAGVAEIRKRTKRDDHHHKIAVRISLKRLNFFHLIC